MIGLLKKAISLIFGKRLVAYICGAEALPKPLTPEEEEQYAVAAKNGDAAAREKLIEHNLRLVVYIAKKFENTSVDTEDLVSIGTIGLIKAVNGFDPEKKIKLATFAGRCIENEILMYLRKTVRLKTEVSLDEPLNVDGEGNELLLGDVLGTDNDLVFKNLETTVEKQLLAEGLKKLSERERKIVDLRFGLDGGEEKTQKEVADLLGISQSYISRLEKKIIKRLKKEISKLF
ncbi:MAG: RNA polymerase sporulation sigma factor SigE [Clostridiales bacterium]|nr:RNA polymerase sporulation sigma factor SigE [Clostridiales bacterium]MDY5726254.1 RNA polymerase sporulation sigma factor SigE [Eubacteriales bacterium]